MYFRAATPPPPAPDAEEALAGRLPRRRRLLFAALLAGLALVGVAGGLASHQYDDAQRTAVNDARARVILAGTIIDTYFSGELATLASIAQSASVRAGDTVAMRAYFKRLQPPHGERFSGGLGWIDRKGIWRVSGNATSSGPLDVSDRSYYTTVMATGAPFVSEGIAARRTRRPIIVLAVPTRDASGRLTGVLAGSLLVNAFQAPGGSPDLGYSGLAVLDRHGRAVLAGFARPRNVELQRRLQQGRVGLLSSTDGLDGDPDHLVAYATAQVPGWTIVIDRPRSSAFAAARRGLVLELALIAIAAAIVFSLIGWTLLRTRRDAELQGARARLRGELSHALGEARLAAEVSDGLANGLAAAFPGALCLVTLEAEDRLGLELAATAGGSPLSALATDLMTAQAATRAYASGVAFALESDARLHEQLSELHWALAGRARSLYCAPLRERGGRAIGALCLLFGDERTLDEPEQANVAWYAEEAAHALGRAQNYEHEHAVAVTLQRSLLGQDLPEIAGVELFGRYQAGGAGLEVGGDWYDVVRRSDGIVHITVGDVAGRGISAAVLMGQMRNAFRAYAYDHASPAEVLRRMRRHITDDAMATAVCLMLDPYTQELTYASAGHPPSLLLAGESGSVLRLDRAGAPPLGFARAEDIREAALAMPPRTTLVAYTDGLVERRDWSLDVGIDLLATVLATGARLDTETLATRIVHDVSRRVGSGDDIALLIVRPVSVPEQMDIEIPSDPAVLADLRRRLRAWLDLRGLSPQERDDAVLSISEACNNAIEHAYVGGSGPIRLQLDHRAGTLDIAVEDHGTWRPPVPNPERGRGLDVMRAVMDETGIEHGSGGTRVLLSQRLAR